MNINTKKVAPANTKNDKVIYKEKGLNKGIKIIYHDD
jgi:hypothetical protein